ncbi:TATA-binding protein-associated phosphoprotein [Entamoeba marina]
MNPTEHCRKKLTNGVLLSSGQFIAVLTNQKELVGDLNTGTITHSYLTCCNQSAQLEFDSSSTQSLRTHHELVSTQLNPLSDCVQSKRDTKNFESIQQAILIGLLSKFGSFTLLRPLKRSKVTFQTIKVESVSFSNDTININELVEQHCKQRYEMELSNGISIEKVKRRFDKNRFVFLSNLLLDLSLEFGYFFDTKMSRNTGGSIQLEKIRRTFL